MSYPFAVREPFQPLSTRPENAAKAACWFLFSGERLLLLEREGSYIVPCSIKPPVPAATLAYSRCIGVYAGTICMAAALHENTAPGNGLAPFSLRQAYAHITGDQWNIAGRASQILHWHLHTQFCGRCGAAMEEQPLEMLKTCPNCDFSTYPRLSPAVIMTVIRDDAILLGRAPRFPPGMYSPLAGYVEAGETLEEAVIREVREEVGIEIADISYVGSQSWPFPHSLMVGFTATYAAGAVTVDKTELEDARWFTATDMPQLPPKISIARALVERFLATATGERPRR